MNKLTSLVVVANSHKAKIFEKIGHKTFDLNLIYEIEADLDSDHEKPGRSFNSTGSLRHAIEPHTDRRLVEKHKFAEKISHNLQELEKTKSIDGLILIASHKILEEIEKTLGNHLKQKITQQFAKNLLEFTNAEIKNYLSENLV